MNPAPQRMLALDLEGVLTPEIWLALADTTEIDDFRRTTRDEPVYEKLMAERLELLKKHDISFDDLSAVVDTLVPLPGAIDFLDAIRAEMPVIILSDTYEQLAAPLFQKLGSPLVLCHRLSIVDGYIDDASVRMPNAKQAAVERFCTLGYRVFAAGDSYNDLTMLQAAHGACLFRSPDNVRAEHPDLPTAEEFSDLLGQIREWS